MVERIRTLLESRQLTPTQFADLIGVARPIVSHILSGRNKPSLEVVQRILAAMPELAMPWLLNGSGPMLAAAGAPAVTVPARPAQEAAVGVPAPPSGNATQLAGRQVDTAPTSVTSASKQLVSSPEPVHATKPVGAETPGTGKPLPAILPKRFIAKRLAMGASASADEPKAAEVDKSTELGLAPASIPTALGNSANPPLEAPSALGLPPTTVSPARPLGNGPQESNALPESAMASALFAGAEKPIRRIVIFYRDGSFADYQPE